MITAMDTVGLIGVLSVVNQWGTSTSSHITYPIVFNVLFAITVGHQSWGAATFENVAWISNKTTSGFDWPTYKGTPINYIALGK